MTGSGVTHRFRRPERWWVRAALNRPYELRFLLRWPVSRKQTFGYLVEDCENFSEPRQGVRHHRLDPLCGVDPDMPSYRRGRGFQPVLFPGAPAGYVKRV
jgi:hypothetical protein